MEAGVIEDQGGTPYQSRPIGEDVRGQAVSRAHQHGDGRICAYHSRLALWTFDGLHECMMGHPTILAIRTREGDQVLPSGDESLEDDQSLIIKDIEARRQVGIERYGQGHRPFNGRDTLQDLYEEQLDLLVYLRSIKRMSEATREDLIEVLTPVIADYVSAWIGSNREAKARVLAGHVVGRLMGWVVGQQIKQEESNG